MEKILIRDEKNSNPGSGINIPDPQHWFWIADLLQAITLSYNIYHGYEYCYIYIIRKWNTGNYRDGAGIAGGWLHLYCHSGDCPPLVS
jgi:hypothetical protein